MKYIITEQQYNMIMEESIPLWFKRRFNAGFMKEFIIDASINNPTPCDDFDNEFEYAHKIIEEAVNNFLETNEDSFDNEKFSEFEEHLTILCRKEFSEELLQDYINTCKEY